MLVSQPIGLVARLTTTTTTTTTTTKTHLPLDKTHESSLPENRKCLEALQWYRVERTEGRNPPPSLLGEEVRGISEENSEGYLRGCDEVKVVIQYQILRLIGAVHEKNKS